MLHIFYLTGDLLCGSISILRDAAPCKTALVTGDAVKQQYAVHSQKDEWILLVHFW